jgi:hypothetical protein
MSPCTLAWPYVVADSLRHVRTPVSLNLTSQYIRAFSVRWIGRGKDKPPRVGVYFGIVMIVPQIRNAQQTGNIRVI